MTERRPWQRGSQYFEGTRVQFLGEVFECKMDLPISIPPIGDPDSKKFWRQVSILPKFRRGNSAADNSPYLRSPGGGYIKKVIR
ncbi:hypothetical protein ACSBOB_18600 [Mesorhizobium sp. ASY16-5R]|uniref:hypothetical protein n=1 Tax=Mesorhizobium sp. ASY16-5R TaxID=3445772 RepID=UPI003FA17306